MTPARVRPPDSTYPDSSGSGAAAAGVEDDVPVVALVRVQVARLRPVLDAPAGHLADRLEPLRHVGVDARAAPDVDLPAVPVAVGAGRVPGLGAAGHHDGAPARRAQGA